MNIINQIEYRQFRQFEDQIDGNVKVGGYKMDEVCPIDEGFFYQIKLEETDSERLFFLYEPTFTSFTRDKNYRVSEIIDDVVNSARVKYWLDWKLDLRLSPEWSPIFVCPETSGGPIITIDGNHRLTAHFHLHKTLEGLCGYVFVHPNIQNWGFIPIGARK